MIKSVTFPEKGDGYIYEIVTKPDKPQRGYYRFRSEDEYLREMEIYKKEMSYYRKNKGKFVLGCSYNLVGKTFNFMDKKINVIFGPNASGKTTIIKSIAGEFLCKDGYTAFVDPLSFGFFGNEKPLSNIIKEHKENTSVVDFDAVPVYYDNFENTRMNYKGALGTLTGSILQNVGEEITYIMSSNRMSSGQNSTFVLNRILQIAEKEVSMKDIADKNNEMFASSNDEWRKKGKLQYDYFAKMDRFEEKSHPVLLFDEIDKSLDIETVWKLYTQYLPMIIDKWGNQIIMVSHNPLILSDNIFNNDAYNIISVDPSYTDDMKNMLKEVKF